MGSSLEPKETIMSVTTTIISEKPSPVFIPVFSWMQPPLPRCLCRKEGAAARPAWSAKPHQGRKHRCNDEYRDYRVSYFVYQERCGQNPHACQNKRDHRQFEYHAERDAQLEKKSKIFVYLEHRINHSPRVRGQKPEQDGKRPVTERYSTDEKDRRCETAGSIIFFSFL
jgi:hypothetical protein